MRDTEQQRARAGPVRATQLSTLKSQPHLVAGTDSSDKKPKKTWAKKLLQVERGEWNINFT